MNFRPFIRETLWNGYNKKRHRSSNLGGTARTVSDDGISETGHGLALVN